MRLPRFSDEPVSGPLVGMLWVAILTVAYSLVAALITVVAAAVF